MFRVSVFCSTHRPAGDARVVVRQYRGQGHDVSFLTVKEWLVSTLGTIGPRCRSMFTDNFLTLLGAHETPAGLSLAGNEHIQQPV